MELKIKKIIFWTSILVNIFLLATLIFPRIHRYKTKNQLLGYLQEYKSSQNAQQKKDVLKQLSNINPFTGLQQRKASASLLYVVDSCTWLAELGNYYASIGDFDMVDAINSALADAYASGSCKQAWYQQDAN